MLDAEDVSSSAVYQQTTITRRQQRADRLTTNAEKHSPGVAIYWIWPCSIQPNLQWPQEQAALCLYLLLLNPIFNLFRGCLVRSEQTDGARKLRIQNVSIFVSDHQVQIQVPSKIQKWRSEINSRHCIQTANLQLCLHFLEKDQKAFLLPVSIFLSLTTAQFVQFFPVGRE